MQEGSLVCTGGEGMWQGQLVTAAQLHSGLGHDPKASPTEIHLEAPEKLHLLFYF